MMFYIYVVFSVLAWQLQEVPPKFFVAFIRLPNKMRGLHFLSDTKSLVKLLSKSRIPGRRSLIGYRTLWETISVSLDIVRERIPVIEVNLPAGLRVEKMIHSFCLMKKQSYMSTMMLKRLRRFDSVAEMREALLCFQPLSLLDISWVDISNDPREKN